MPVIVNELEVVVAPAENGEAPAADAPAAQRPAPPLTPLEIAELLERRSRIAMRVLAH